MKRKKGEIHFQARKHSVSGNLSVFIALLNLAVLGALAWTSGLNGGSSGISAGIGGILVFLSCACGFMIALYSFGGKDIYYTASVAGLLMNGILFAVCLGLYLIGAGI